MLVDSAAVPGHGERAGDAAPAQDAGGASKEPSSDMDDLLVDEKMLKEEEAAREERKTADRPRAGGGLTHERLQKLDVLLDQAQMYSKFLTEQVETIQKEIEVVRYCSLAACSLCCVAAYTRLAWLSGPAGAC